MGYKVRYVPGSGNDIRWRNISAVPRQVNLTALVKNMNYSIEVLASTIKGDGPFNKPPLFALTNQKSK